MVSATIFDAIPKQSGAWSERMSWCLAANSREHVDTFIDRGVAAGETADPAAKPDYGVNPIGTAVPEEA